MKKTLCYLLVLFFTALFLRVWQLGNIPVSLSDDEVRLVYNAYSIWKTGKDVNGSFLPLAFLNNGFAFNPVPIYLVSPIVGIFGLSIFTARIFFAATGALTVLFLFGTVRKLLKNSTIALLSSLALVFSPWHIHIARIAYEGEVSLFFFTIGIYFFLLISKQRFKFLILSLLMFILGFYSYSGYKLIFLPVLITLIVYKIKELNMKQLIFISVSIIATFAFFGYLSKYQGAGSYGAGQFFFQDNQATALAVELERRASPAPEILKKLYHNKLTYWGKIFLERYQYALSAQYLFINQEGSGIFSMWFRGQYYYHEALLICLGLLYLFLRHRREFLLLVSLMLIAPLPSGLGPNPVNYSIRSSLLLPVFAIAIGSGIYGISYFVKQNRLKFLLFTILVLLYTYFIGGYLTQYYYEWMRYGAQYYSKATRDAVDTIEKEKNNNNRIVVDGFETTQLLHFAFYTGRSPTDVQQQIKQNPRTLGKLFFHSDCTPAGLREQKTTYIIPLYCIQKKDTQFYSTGPTNADYIVKSLDGNDEWFVFKN